MFDNATFEKRKAEFEAELEKRRKYNDDRQAQNPFKSLSSDFFSRFSRDNTASPSLNETAIDETWGIFYLPGSHDVAALMAGHLADFFSRCMGVKLPVSDAKPASGSKYILLSASGGGEPEVEESFTISVLQDSITVSGRDIGGLRSGAVRLIGLMGLRRAPYLERGATVYKPRITVRNVAVSDLKYNVFCGANATQLFAGDIYEFSRSLAIPELVKYQKPGLFESLAKSLSESKRYGLKVYMRMSNFRRFDFDDPVFLAHPDIRGTKTWADNGQYTICTEHPLMQKYLSETIEGLFRALPGLDGTIFIIGGESFYHCFMRSYGANKGHSACPRCEALGAERVVADLCNLMARAARKVNPQAEMIAWPYSAEHVWSADRAQEGLMRLCEPGVSLLTELEKDEYAIKPGGIRKHLWDYSIDMTGPGTRARRQLEVSAETGVPVHSLSMAEMSFEAALTPGIPVLDRWCERAEKMSEIGLRGAFIWNMAPFYGKISTEQYQYAWFSPAPDREKLLSALACRAAGNAEAGAALREAWRECSRGFEYLPVINGYYTGPQYLGPACPIVCDPDADIPEIFCGYMLFLFENTPEEGMKPRDLFQSKAPWFKKDSKDYIAGVSRFEIYYRTAEDYFRRAAAALERVIALVPQECRMTFDSEALSVMWFYRTTRSCANVYEAYRLSAELEGLSGKNEEDRECGLEKCDRFAELLKNERENAEAGLEIARKDPRVETIWRGDHSFNAICDMLEAKLKLCDEQLAVDIPKLRKRFQ